MCKTSLLFKISIDKDYHYQWHVFILLLNFSMSTLFENHFHLEIDL